MQINILDLFSGCGGFSLGIKSSSPKFRIISAIDIDEMAINSYKYNFRDVNPELVLNRDITTLSPKELHELLKKYKLQKIDCIIGGPPCPGFSNIGRSKIMGLIRENKWQSSEMRHSFIEDPRNQLFYNFVEYTEFFQPKFFIFENVKGLGSYKVRISDSTLDMIELICHELENIGYKIDSELLNAADYGVPQLRERYFIVGQKKGISKTYLFHFPVPTHTERKDIRETAFQTSLYDFWNHRQEQRMPYITTMQALIDLPPFVNFVEDKIDKEYDYQYSIGEAIQIFKEFYGNQFLSETDQTFPEMEKFLKTVRGVNNLLKSGGGELGKIRCHYPRPVNDLGDREIFPLLRTEPREDQDSKIMYRDLPDRLKRYDDENFGDKMRRIPWWAPSWTIIAHLSYDGYMFIHPDRITPQHRSITVREAARLQSFPDTFDFGAGGQISRGNQFKHVGNAVPPLLARALGESLLNAFQNLEKIQKDKF